MSDENSIQRKVELTEEAYLRVRAYCKRNSLRMKFFMSEALSREVEKLERREARALEAFESAKKQREPSPWDVAPFWDRAKKCVMCEADLQTVESFAFDWKSPICRACYDKETEREAFRSLDEKDSYNA